MFWAILNGIFGLSAAGIVTYKLVVIPYKFNRLELLGMGLIGSGMVLTIALLLERDTPFDDWSTALLRAGCCVYFVGRLLRHRLANWTMKRQARAHLEGER